MSVVVAQERMQQFVSFAHNFGEEMVRRSSRSGKSSGRHPVGSRSKRNGGHEKSNWPKTTKAELDAAAAAAAAAAAVAKVELQAASAAASENVVVAKVELFVEAKPRLFTGRFRGRSLWSTNASALHELADHVLQLVSCV